MKQMEAVRQKVLAQPGTLPRLVLQLQQGDTDSQTKAAEMLFCVVGQGPGRDKEATKQVSSDSHMPKGHLLTVQEAMSNFIASHPLIASKNEDQCIVVLQHPACLSKLSAIALPFDTCVCCAAGTRQQAFGRNLGSH